MTITDALNLLYQTIATENITIPEYLYDDEDMTVFALNYLRANLDIFEDED